MDVKSRPKAQLSCNICRQRKIKCNREFPCRQCLKLPPGSCVYPPPTTLPTASSQGNSRAKTSNIDNRIDRLERLVATITNSDAHENSARLVQEDRVPDTPPRLHADGDKTRFMNASHWESILNDIADIKDELQASPSTQERKSPGKPNGPYLLFGDHYNASEQELSCSLPTQTAITTLLNLLIENDVLPSLLTVVHVPTLRKECEAYWQDPAAVSLPWLALLYSILALGLQTALRLGINVDGFPNRDAAAHMYNQRAAQCLIKSDYTKPTTYTIEAIVLYLISEHYWAPDGHFHGCLILNTTIRLAISIGYHRDPRHYQNMSVLQSEMRRRTWAFIIQMDLLLSEKCGLPRVIHERQTDTLPPLSVRDEDLDHKMTEPPLARPESEPTNSAYLNYKTRLLKVQGRIADRTNGAEDMNYEETLRLDQELISEIAHKPLWLQDQDEQQYHSTPPQLFNQKLEIDTIIQRAQMVLHRKWILSARTSEKYAYSRTVCLTAAQNALHYQHELSSTGLQSNINANNWRFVSILSHHFLMAAMLLSSDLYRGGSNAVPLSSNASSGQEELQRAERFQLLKECHRLWKEHRHESVTAEKATQTLGIMLERLCRISRDPLQRQTSGYGLDLPPSTTAPTTTVYEAKDRSIDYDDANGLIALTNMEQGLNGQITGGSQHAMWLSGHYQELDLNNIQNILSAPQMDIDWAAWDAEYVGSGWNFP